MLHDEQKCRRLMGKVHVINPGLEFVTGSRGYLRVLSST